MLNRIKSYLNFQKDAEFARFLEIKPNVLSNWYKRGTFDAELIYTMCDFLNPSWLLTDKGEMIFKSEKTVSGLTEINECKSCEGLRKDIEHYKQIIDAKDETIRAYRTNEDSKDENRHSA